MPLPAPENDRLNDLVMDNVLAELARRRVTQRQAARSLGISEATFSDRVRGRTRLTLDDIERFAALLDVDPAELLARRGRGGTPARGGRDGGAFGLPRLDSNQQPSD